MYKSVQLVNQLVFIIKYVPHLPGSMDPKRPRHSPYFSLKLESSIEGNNDCTKRKREREKERKGGREGGREKGREGGGGGGGERERENERENKLITLLRSKVVVKYVGG